MTFTQIHKKRELARKVEALMDRGDYPSTAVISAMCQVIDQLCTALETVKHDKYAEDYKP